MTEVPAVNPNVVAPFGRRVGAYFIDVGLWIALVGGMFAIWWLITLVLSKIAMASGAYWLYWVSGLMIFVAYVLAFLGYPAIAWYLTATRGYTPGKKLLGLRVVDEVSGEPIGYGRSAVRVLVLNVAGFFCGIVAIVMAILTAQHPRQQGWHDLAAKSVVVPLDPTTGTPVVAIVPVPHGEPAPPSSPYAIRPDAAAHPSPSVDQVPPPVPAAPPVYGGTPRPPVPVAPPGVPGPVGGLIPPAPGLIPPPPTASVSPPPMAGAPVAAPQHPTSESDPPDRWAMTIAGSDVARPLRTWTLEAPDGSVYPLDDAVIVGRNPEPSGEFATATPWRVTDPDLSMSKSHAAFGSLAGEPWVQDLGSTNGVVIQRAGQQITVLDQKVSLLDGDTVRLGDVPLRVKSGQ